MYQVEGKIDLDLNSTVVKKQVLLGFARLSLTVVLTPAELNIGRMLLCGNSVTCISVKTGRSIKTISTQKRGLFSKVSAVSDFDFFIKVMSFFLCEPFPKNTFSD
ncbi:hypothetical protein ACMV5I_26225 [Serratia sp. T13T92]|uniref:hypothetical protein n=1 Tax=Serratia sp. T13T92 TaxID=3397496 RepID=UPI0039DF34C3